MLLYIQKMPGTIEYLHINLKWRREFVVSYEPEAWGYPLFLSSHGTPLKLYQGDLECIFAEDREFAANSLSSAKMQIDAPSIYIKNKVARVFFHSKYGQEGHPVISESVRMSL